MKFGSFMRGLKKRNALEKDVSPDNGCIIQTAQDLNRIFCTLPNRKRDDALNLISTAIQKFKAGDSAVIEFASLPSEDYNDFLRKEDDGRDSIVNRANYLLQHDESGRRALWNQSGRGTVDVMYFLAFFVWVPDGLSEGEEYLTKYRMTKDACGKVKDAIQALCPDGRVFVSREIIHWAEYLINPDTYYTNALSELDEGVRCYCGGDVEQRFGPAGGPHFMLPLLGLYVVVRRHLPHTLPVTQAEDFLSSFNYCMGPHEERMIVNALLESGIDLRMVFDCLLPYSQALDVVNSFFSKKGFKLLFQSA